MAADDMKEINDLTDDFDISDLDLENEEKGARRAPSGRVFWMFTLGLAVVVITVLGVTAYLTGFLPVKGIGPVETQGVPPQATNTETAGGGLPLPAPESVTPLPSGGITTPVPERKYEQTPIAAIPSPTMVLEITEEGALERTATVAALLTQAAAVLTQTTGEPQGSETPANAPTVAITPLTALPTVMVTPVTTALPKTGWADEVGLPMMIIMAVALIAVIVFVRTLRTARSG